MAEKGFGINGTGQMQDNLGRFASKVESAILVEAQALASEMLNDMRQATYAQRRWEDRTGEARDLLKAEAFIVGASGEGIGRQRTGTLAGFNNSGSRDGSFSAPVGASNGAGGVTHGVIIVLSGGSDHNLWLEIAMGARYSVIRTTSEAYAGKVTPRLEKALKDVS